MRKSKAAYARILNEGGKRSDKEEVEIHERRGKFKEEG